MTQPAATDTRPAFRRPGQTPKDERGFSLNNIIFAIAVTVTIVLAYNTWSAHRDRVAATATARAAFSEIRKIIVDAMKNDHAWNNSLLGSARNSLHCFHDHTSCPEHGVGYELRDQVGRTIVDSTSPTGGLTLEKQTCTGFSETGSETCPFRVDLSWSTECTGDCIDPRTIALTAKLRFRPGPNGLYAGIKIPEEEFTISRTVRTTVPRNCYEVMQAGNTHDGTYSIRPDPKKPVISIYCDQTRFGGGWALALATANEGYKSIPESTAVTPGVTSRLSADLVKAYLDTSSFTSENNLRLEFPGIDGGVNISASTNGSTDAELYTAATPNDDCRNLRAKPNPATHKASQGFGLYFTGPGLAGLDEQSSAADGYHGLMVCFGKTPGGLDCGVGCNRKWRGQLFRQRGFIWIR